MRQDRGCAGWRSGDCGLTGCGRLRATAGLDFESRRALRQRLLGRDGERRTTAVIASHEVGEVEKLATHLLLLKKGEVVGFGTLEEVLRGRSMDTLVEESVFSDEA